MAAGKSRKSKPAARKSGKSKAAASRGSTRASAKKEPAASRASGRGGRSRKVEPTPDPAKSKTERRTARLPASLKALDADFGAVLRMRNVRWMIVMAAVVGALIFGWYLSAVFVPLLVAASVAYILNPLVVKLQERGLSRTRAVLLIFAAFIAFSIAAGSWFAASVVKDVRAIGLEIGSIIEDVRKNQRQYVEDWNHVAPEFAKLDPEDITLDAVLNVAKEELAPAASQTESPEAVRARAASASARAELLAGFQRLDRNNDLALTAGEVAPAQLAEMDGSEDGTVTTSEWFDYFGAPTLRTDGRGMAPGARAAAQGVVDWVSSSFMKLFTFLLFITLVPIYTWYFMIGFNGVTEKVREYLPGSHRERILRIIGEIDEMAKAFFRGRLVIVAIIATLSTILFLCFGVRYAVLLGLMAGLGILIPYFSILAALVPAVLLMLVDDKSGVALGAMAALFFGIQALEQYVLTPKLLGDAVELHPVTLLVGVFVMASLFGVFGALLAVPLTAIAKTLGREFLLPYFKSLAREKPTEP